MHGGAIAHPQGIILDTLMGTPRYALVAYVRNPVGAFVEKLRQELHPELPHLEAHLTILPPRRLQGSENSARELLDDICKTIEPFEVDMGEVETFSPLTPTVFIRVARGAYRMRELHDRLNTQSLGAEEEWPYMPHLTIIKMAGAQQADHALAIARARWSGYTGTRHVPVEELTFVREDQENCWIDLAPVPLGGRLVSRYWR